MDYIAYLFFGVVLMTAPASSLAQSATPLSRAYNKGVQYEINDLDSASHYFGIVDSLAYIEQDSAMMSEAGIFFTSYYNVLGESSLVEESYHRAYPYVTDTGSLLTIINSYGADQAKVNVQRGDSILSIGIALIDLYSKPSNQLGPIYNNYASLQLAQGELAKSAHYYQLAIDQAEKPFGRFQTYLSLVGVFQTMGNTQGMKDYIDKAIRLSEQEGYKSRNGTLALYYASYLIQNGDTSTAKNEIDKAISFQPFMNKRGFKKSLLSTQKSYYSAIDNWQKYDDILRDAEDEISDLDLQSHESILYAKAETDYHLERYPSALRHARESLTVAKAQSRKIIEKNANRLLGKIYYRTGTFDKAASHTAASDQLSEEIYRNNQTQHINYLDGLFQKKESELKVAQLEVENQSKGAKLVNQRKKLLGGAVVLGLISLLAFFLWRMYQQVVLQKQIISKSLEEKDLLLREIHHRVKNNLQMVSSLLTLQGRSLDDQSAQVAIQEGKNRVRSMALIHQDLYNKENLTDIGVKEYIEKLTRELLSTYKSKNIALQTDITDIDLDIDTMIPLGLIINELITNSLKYGFPDGRKGKIEVSLIENGNQLQLKVKDNGVGYDTNIIRAKSFGTTLINALTAQLEGTLTTHTEDGTDVSITFHTNPSS